MTIGANFIDGSCGKGWRRSAAFLLCKIFAIDTKLNWEMAANIYMYVYVCIYIVERGRA